MRRLSPIGPGSAKITPAPDVPQALAPTVKCARCAIGQAILARFGDPGRVPCSNGASAKCGVLAGSDYDYCGGISAVGNLGLEAFRRPPGVSRVCVDTRLRLWDSVTLRASDRSEEHTSELQS